MMPATHRKKMPIIMKIVRTTELKISGRDRTDNKAERLFERSL